MVLQSSTRTQHGRLWRVSKQLASIALMADCRRGVMEAGLIPATVAVGR